MSISVQCPGCERMLKANVDLAGKSVKCPSCGHVIVVPTTRQATELPPTSHQEGCAETTIEGKPTVAPPSVPKVGAGRWLLYAAGLVIALCLFVGIVWVFAMPAKERLSTKNESAAESAPMSGQETHGGTKPEAPANKKIEKTSVLNVTNVLTDLGFEVASTGGHVWQWNVGAETFTCEIVTYKYVHKKTGAELTLVRNVGWFGIPGLRWRVVASNPKGREALLALASHISPELRAACDACVAGQTETRKSVGQKPMQLNVGWRERVERLFDERLFIETDPAPDPFP
jgi:hypothetical protein